ncbi:hypothetical protein GMSM_30470 [Geomonas sp. Red276]
MRATYLTLPLHKGRVRVRMGLFPGTCNKGKGEVIKAKKKAPRFGKREAFSIFRKPPDVRGALERPPPVATG